MLSDWLGDIFLLKKCFEISAQNFHQYGLQQIAENYEMRLSGANCVLRVCGFTFGKSSIGLVQRLKAAAVLIDGLHLRIFVMRRRVSRITAKKTGSTFSGNTDNSNGCLLPASLEWRWCSISAPLLFLSLNAPLFHLPYRQHRESFRELHADCSKVKRTTPIMQPALQRAELFILQIYYWRGVTTNYWTPSFSRCLPSCAHGPAAILFFPISNSKWCFSICAFALVSLVLQINKGVESGMKSDRIIKIFHLCYCQLWMKLQGILK